MSLYLCHRSHFHSLSPLLSLILSFCIFDFHLSVFLMLCCLSWSLSLPFSSLGRQGRSGRVFIVKINHFSAKATHSQSVSVCCVLSQGAYLLWFEVYVCMCVFVRVYVHFCLFVSMCWCTFDHVCVCIFILVWNTCVSLLVCTACACVCLPVCVLSCVWHKAL